MDAQPTITLRDAARKIPRLLNLRKKTAVSELHGLLKSGDLRAGFQFQARAERWIAIPTSYWASIGADKLRTLFYEEGNTERPGTFKVPIRRFAKEFAQAVSNELQNDQGIQNDPDLSGRHC
jgi:hypothetical protein